MLNAHLGGWIVNYPVAFNITRLNAERAAFLGALK